MKEKRLRLITEILAILAICLISFVGVYKQNLNKMENMVKGYELGKDFFGYRECIIKVSDANQVLDKDGKLIGDTDSLTDSVIESNSYQKTENKVNSDDILTEENYQKSKEIIEKRLKGLNVQDYNISLNKEDGTIYLGISENSDTDHTLSNILQVANFKVNDSKDSSKVFLTNDDLKNVSAMYNTTQAGTTVYLQMELDKNGKNILKELSEGDYKTVEVKEDENNNEDNNNTTTEGGTEENTDSENEDTESKEYTQNKITLSIDTNEMITTSFDDPIVDGKLFLSMGQASTDSEKISQSLKSASTIGVMLNNGKMPISYKIVENQYVNANSLSKIINNCKYAIIALAIVLAVFLIVKYKARGLLALVSFAGFLALYLLIIRYTNVFVTFDSIVASLIIITINYLMICKILKINEQDLEVKKKVYRNALISTIIELIPVFIISIIFAFIKWESIATFGMNMFWGILLSIIYNYILTKDMLN